MAKHQEIKVPWQYDTRFMISHVSKALKQAGHDEDSSQFIHEAFASQSPEEVYEVAERYVELV